MPKALVQPKKPACGAFGVFLIAKRPEYAKALTGQSSSEVVRMGGEAWKKLKDAEKEPYQKEYEKKKAKFDKDMAAFLAAGGEKTKGAKGILSEKKKAKELNQKNGEDAEEGEEESPPKKKGSKAVVKASPAETKKVENPDSDMDVAKEEAFLKQLKGMLDDSSHGPQVLLDALQAAGGSVDDAKQMLVALKVGPPMKKSSTVLMKVSKKGSKAPLKVKKKGSKALKKVNNSSLKKMKKTPVSKKNLP